jgi:hypothetical protein
MRLWSLHPSYLDSKGLVAAWREGLLARAVLRGVTVGYQHHPQLERFRSHPAPLSAINNYLRGLYLEADRRGYHFDRTKFGPVRNNASIPVTIGQLRFEMRHLSQKVHSRSPGEKKRLPQLKEVKPHPMFRVRPGPREHWERGMA